MKSILFGNTRIRTMDATKLRGTYPAETVVDIAVEEELALSIDSRIVLIAQATDSGAIDYTYYNAVNCRGLDGGQMITEKKTAPLSRLLRFANIFAEKSDIVFLDFQDTIDVLYKEGLL